jgi:hypothetical protein
MKYLSKNEPRKRVMVSVGRFYSYPPHRLRHCQVINDDITVNFLHHFATVHFLLVFWLHTTAHTVHTVLTTLCGIYGNNKNFTV